MRVYKSLTSEFAKSEELKFGVSADSELEQIASRSRLGRCGPLATATTMAQPAGDACGPMSCLAVVHQARAPMLGPRDRPEARRQSHVHPKALARVCCRS